MSVTVTVTNMRAVDNATPKLRDARTNDDVHTLGIIMTLDDGDECEWDRRFPSKQAALAELARLPYRPVNMRARFDDDGTFDALIRPAMVTA